MTRLLSTLLWDARLQFRNGFYYASAFVAVVFIVLLSQFNMPQEIVPQAPSFGCPFNDPGYICHHEASEVTVFDDAEVGFEGGEFVVGNFGFCRGHY